MELKPRYKLTEVGVIPEDWEVKSFTEVTDLITCGIAATPEYVSESVGYPFLSSTNVKEGRIIWSGYKHISAQLHRQLYRNNSPKRGDILYSRVGTFGEAAVIDVDFEFSIYVSLTLIKPGKELDSYFLTQLLNTSSYKRRAKDQVFLGSGVGNLNVEVVRQYPIVVPPLPEQRAIATVLSDTDALIESLDRLISKKRDVKQATMQQLLTGKTRLPGFSGEWEVKQLGEVLTICHGKSQRDVEAIDGPYPILATGGQIGTASHSIYDRPSVLIGRKGTINKPQYMDTPFWTVDTLFYSEMKGSNNARFFFYLFCTIDWMQFNEASGVPSLNARTIENIEIDWPETREQTAIATVLSDLDAEIAALEARRDKTRALKQGMMQELLTGKTRLVKPEAAHG
jgi:type I restriction enzyme S subunit